MTSARRIDHLVLAVHDLDAAATFYDRIGFQVGARNRHPWGTENRVVQLGSSYLELIAVAEAADIPPHGPQSFSFGAFVRDYLREREGLAMLALSSADAEADAAELSRLGLGDAQPFSFERDGRRPDGTPTHLGFSLAFARHLRVGGACFFVCQHHTPDAFWDPALQQHRNGATDVSAVVLDTAAPDDAGVFLRGFASAGPAGDGRTFRLAHTGRVEVEEGSGRAGFTAFAVRVPALGPVSGRLTREGVSFRAGPDRIEVPSRQAFGVGVVFERTRPTEDAEHGDGVTESPAD